MHHLLSLGLLLICVGFCIPQYQWQEPLSQFQLSLSQRILNTGNSLDYNPGSNAGYNPDYSPGYSSSSNGGFCGFLGKFLMCQCTEEAICEENLIPYGYCPMHPMMPMVRTQCCPKSYVMMCSQQNNPYETQGGSYFLMMQSAANREL